MRIYSTLPAWRSEEFAIAIGNQASLPKAEIADEIGRALSMINDVPIGINP
jgi:hypothetical protein